MLKTLSTRVLLAIIFLLTIHENSIADQITARFEVPFETGFFSGGSDEEARQKLRALALREIWSAYQAKQESSNLRLIEQSKKKINSRIMDIVTGVTLRERKLEDRGVIVVIAQGTVNTALLNTILFGASKQSGSGEYIGYIVIPRVEVKSLETSFDDRVKKGTKVSRQEIKENASRESLSESGGVMKEKSIANTKSKNKFQSETAGQTIKMGPETVSVWGLYDKPNDVTSRFSQFFSSAGYELTDYNDIIGQCPGPTTSQIRKATVKTGQMQASLRRQVLQTLKKCDISFLVIGTLDVDTAQIDRNSGRNSARASVNLQVLDLRKRFPRTLATIGPEYTTALGRSKNEAVAGALKIVAGKGAELVISSLRAKGIR